MRSRLIESLSWTLILPLVLGKLSSFLTGLGAYDEGGGGSHGRFEPFCVEAPTLNLRFESSDWRGL